MLVRTGIILPITLNVTTAYGDLVLNANPTLTIKRQSDLKYFNTSTWQTSEYTIPMPRNFQSLYTYNFNIPVTPDTYICFANDSTNKVSGAVVLEATDKIENLDRKVSDTLLTTNYIAPDNTGIANLNNKINLNLDMKISDLPTAQEIWSDNLDKQLSVSNVQGIGSCSVTVNTTNVTSIEIYDSNNVAKYELIPSANIGTIKLNPGTYYFVALKDNYFPRQVIVNVPSASNYSVDITLSPILNGSDLNLKVRELPTKSTVYKDEVLKVGIELFSDKDFSITSATASAGTVEVIGKKVFSKVTFSAVGTIVVEFDVVVGTQTITHRLTKKVI